MSSRSVGAVIVFILALFTSLLGSVGSAYGCYSIVVTASPTALGSGGGSSTITAVVRLNGNPVVNHTIRFTVNGQGSVSPVNVDTDATGTATTTYTIGGGGAAVITGTDLDRSGQPSDDCTVTAFTIAQDYDLWWFGGVTIAEGGGYHTWVTLTAEGTSTGTFQWTVVAGFDKAGFFGFATDTVTFTDSNTVQVKSKNGSTVEEVRISFRYNGIAVDTWPMTVWAPSYTMCTACPTHNAFGNGYQTLMNYITYDQFYAELPYVVDASEAWVGAESHDYSGEQWPWPSPAGVANANPSDWHDEIRYNGADYPSVMNPQTPLTSTKVQSRGQDIRFGSTTSGQGKLVKGGTLKFYLDHGDGM